jgi:3-oxoacyl-[acyl-carrier protein] reductase
VARAPVSRGTALVTGGNHGIGLATARALERDGFDVAVTYLRFDAPERDLPPEYHDARAQEAAAGVVRIEADLRDPATPARVFDEVEAALGPVCVLVNNASGWRKDTFADPVTVSADAADMQLLVDARGGALMIAELARRFRGTWGRVISLTSGGPMGFPGEVSYGAAKAALENYTMSASIELAPKGITANVVYPPVTDTGWITDDVRAFVERSTDHWHIAPPEDVAEVIAWLCQPAADLVTGNIIRLR